MGGDAGRRLENSTSEDLGLRVWDFRVESVECYVQGVELG